MDLRGKSAVVTGASLGIGLAVSEALIDRGTRVAGLARDAGRLQQMSKRLGEAFHPISCDVGDASQVTNAIRGALGALGTIDILINNAGIGRFGAVDKLPQDQWDEMFSTNVFGLHHCIREVVPVMKAQGGGHILNVASVAGMVGGANASGYNATKFAVRGLSEALSKELGEFNIKVTALYPGAVDTTFSGARRPSGSAGVPPQEIAEVVLHVLQRSDGFLISEMVVLPFPTKG